MSSLGDRSVDKFLALNAEQKTLDPPDAAEQLRLWVEQSRGVTGTMLRRVGVYVEEPAPGRYRWVLIEQIRDTMEWKELQAAEETCDNWSDAATAGHVALHRMAPDERSGPRTLA